MSLIQVLSVLLEKGVSNLVGLSSVNKEFRQALWGKEANYFLKRRLVLHFNGKKLLHLYISNRIRIGSTVTTPWQIQVYENNVFQGTLTESPTEITFLDHSFQYQYTTTWEQVVEWSRMKLPAHPTWLRHSLIPNKPARIFLGHTFSYNGLGSFDSAGFQHVLSELGISILFLEKSTIMVTVRKQGSFFNWLLATFK